MNIFSSFFKGSGNTFSEKVQYKKILFGFSDSLTFHKLVFGFFADRFSRKETKELSKYEWFASSLSEALLRNQVEEFLETEEAKKLKPETLEQLILFVKTSQASSEDGYSTDLVRSNNLGLVLLAKTGMDFWEKLDTFSTLEEEIAKKVPATLEKIKALNPGEIHLFGAGTLTHETQILVKRIDEDFFEFVDVEPNSNCLSAYLVSQEEILKPKIWEEIYKKKFLPDYNYKHTELFALFQKHNDPKRVDAASLSSQKTSSCHIRSRLGMLKVFLVLNTLLPTEEAIIEWRLFKTLFGHFLLGKQQIDNDHLCSLAERRQTKREQNFEIAARFFEECIKEGRVDETIEAYQEVFKRLRIPINSILWEKREQVKLRDLLSLHQALLNKMEESLALPEQWDIFFENTRNPWVMQALEGYKRRIGERQEVWKRKLDEELAQPTYLRRSLDSVYRPIQDRLRLELALRLGIYFSSDASMMGAKKSREEIIPALNSEDLNAYLDKIEKNHSLLSPLKKREGVNVILIQALQNGQAERVEKILAAFPEQDRDEFYQELGFKLRMLLPMLSASLEDYVLKHYDTKLAYILIQVLLMKNIPERNFKLNYLFNSHPAVQNFAKDHYYTLGLKVIESFEDPLPSIEEIQKLIVELSEKNALFQGDPIVYQALLFSIGRALMQKGAFELFSGIDSTKLLPIKTGATPPFMHQFPSLSKEEVEKWLELAKKNPSHPLSPAVRFFLVLPSYHHGLHMDADTFAHGSTYSPQGEKEFSHEWRPDQFEEGIAFLKQHHTEMLSNLLFADLLKLAQREGKGEWVSRLLEIKPISKLTALIREELIDENVLLFISKEISKWSFFGECTFTIGCISLLLDSPSIECYKLANEMIKTMEIAQLSDVEIPEIHEKEQVAARVRYLNAFPQSPLALLLRQNTLKLKFQKLKRSPTQREKRDFIASWLSSLEEEDDALQIYEKYMSPIFTCEGRTLDTLFEIWENIPPSEKLRDAFAIFFLNRGYRNAAYWVYPDWEALDKLQL